MDNINVSEKYGCLRLREFVTTAWKASLENEKHAISMMSYGSACWLMKLSGKTSQKVTKTI